MVWQGKKDRQRVPIMAAATPHLEGAASLHGKPSVLDPTVATQATGEGWKERKRKLKLGRRCVLSWVQVIQRGTKSLMWPKPDIPEPSHLPPSVPGLRRMAESAEVLLCPKSRSCMSCLCRASCSRLRA